MTDTNHRRTPKKNQTRLMEMAKHSRNQSRCDDQARSKWKKLSSRSARRKDRYYEQEKPERARAGIGWQRKTS
jgi:hypothetical protein